MKSRPSVILARLRSSQTSEDALREIASALRSGEADEHFLAMLANTIDPDVEKPIVGVRLIPKRVKRGAPKSFNRPLADFIAIKRTNGECLDAIVSEAVHRFNVSERTCYNALAKLDYERALESQYRDLLTYASENK
jgi:hypothetical protein